jgi:hypothetical protein
MVTPTPIFAPLLRPSWSGCELVEVAVLALLDMDIVVLVEKLAFGRVVVAAELLELDDGGALVLDTPIVAAIDTPSFSSQHVVFPP